MYGGAALTQQFVSTFKEFPPRQRPASFSVDQIMEGFYNRAGQ
jgi:arylsulfatase